MRPDDRQSAFPTTRWSRILAPGGRRDLDDLARAYARPIQAWLAARVRCRHDDAQDLAQEAFVWLLQTRLLDKADPARGPFRGFLKRALANFATEQRRRSQAKKRGGGLGFTSHDAIGEPVDPHARSPEQALDDAWRRELLARAQAQLQRELEANGRSAYWALFRDYFLAAGDEPDHATLASRHGITRTDVANWLDHGKRRYRAILRALVADTVTSEMELQEELRWLFGAGAARGPS
ncbi:MAG: sigma-70 family RNA polymerase sigma factor [Planctomycetes bacterium]|nr:sigma-70 family RNA polymerase sigma factor [Planctomycetota bacterium]